MTTRTADPVTRDNTGQPAYSLDLNRVAMWSLVGLVGLRIVTSWNWLNGAFLGKDRKIAPDFLSGTGVTMTVAVMRPPVNAANNVHPSARAGSPACAIDQPSHKSGTSIGSPGIRNRMDVIAPP